MGKRRKKPTRDSNGNGGSAARIEITEEMAQAGIIRGSELGPPKPRGQEQAAGRQSTRSIPQIASKDVIAIGRRRYVHFRCEHGDEEVQVVFTGPEGVEPEPELVAQFEARGWRQEEPGMPWMVELDKSTEENPSARENSRKALHKQFLQIIEEYRAKRGMPALESTRGWRR